MRALGVDIELVGDGLPVPCPDGVDRPYLNLDAAASTSALPAVTERVGDFLPWYSSVHRGAGYKSQLATAAYEDAREAIRRLAGRSDRDDVRVTTGRRAWSVRTPRSGLQPGADAADEGCQGSFT